MPTGDVVVIGAAGAQARALLAAADRAGAIRNWTAVDRSWGEREKYACELLGIPTVELDLLDQPDQLRELLLDASLAINLAGPYYCTGSAVLEACVDVGCDYLDICDDADATVAMLAMDEEVRAAGVRALVGMGASPGVTNVLVRAGRDWLGEADEVSLSWIVDITDVNDAALQHFWHTLAPVGPDGLRQPVPAWEQLSLRTVEFPAPLGERMVVELSHPEPVTIPRFLGIETVHNFGSVIPEDALVVNWSLARLGAAGADRRLAVAGTELSVPALAQDLYRRYREDREPTEYLGGGLVVDVWSGEEGVRFTAADRIGIEEATGVPAAAGALLMLEAGPEEAGVFAPECLDPAEFFSRFGRVSRGSGALGAYRLWGSEQGVRIRIRDLLTTRTR